MSKSKNKNYYDDYEDHDYYGPKSDYLNKKKNKRIARALKTRDVDSLLKNNDDYDPYDRNE
jgi:hypothetical protein